MLFYKISILVNVSFSFVWELNSYAPIEMKFYRGILCNHPLLLSETKYIINYLKIIFNFIKQNYNSQIIHLYILVILD